MSERNSMHFHCLTNYSRHSLGYILGVAFLLLPLLGQDSGETKSARSSKGGKNSKSGKNSTPAGPADAVHDVVSTSFASDDASNLLASSEDLKPLLKQLKTIDESGPIKGWSTTRLAVAVRQQCKNNNREDDCEPAVVTASLRKSDVAYVFHIVTWSHEPMPAAESGKAPPIPEPTYPISSDWYVYELHGTDTLVSTGFSGDGNPRMYNKKQVLIVGVDRFKDPTMSGAIYDAYKSSATPGAPENQTDLLALANALLGISGAKAPAATPEAKFPGYKIFIASGIQPGTAHLPFDLKVTVTSDDHKTSTKKTSLAPVIHRDGAAGADGGVTPPQNANNANPDVTQSNGGNK